MSLIYLGGLHTASFCSISFAKAAIPYSEGQLPSRGRSWPRTRSRSQQRLAFMLQLTIYSYKTDSQGRKRHISVLPENLYTADTVYCGQRPIIIEVTKMSTLYMQLLWPQICIHHIYVDFFRPHRIFDMRWVVVLLQMKPKRLSLVRFNGTY